MTRSFISSGSTFEAEIGYSRAVVQGEWIFVSGTTGFDYSTMTISDDLAEQTEQSLKNIASALAQAGSSLADVVRVTYVLPDGSQFKDCWPVLRHYFGAVRPAAMMISAGLNFSKSNMCRPPRDGYCAFRLRCQFGLRRVSPMDTSLSCATGLLRRS